MAEELNTPEWMQRQLEAAVNDSRKGLIDWEQKVTLSGAVGNGAGLVLLGGALINGWKLNLFLAVLPSMWAFALGLILAAIAPFIAMRGYAFGYRGTLAQLGEYLGQPAGNYVELDDGLSASQSIATAAARDKTAMAFVIASGAFFALGVLWPLLVVTFAGQEIGPPQPR